MYNPLTAVGAYGRIANAKDWKDGKDFAIYQGPYFSIRDTVALKKNGYSHVRFHTYTGHFLFEVTL